MRYVAAYLLAALGGKENPAAADIEKILSSVGIEVDKEKLTKVINELKGKNIAELMEKGETLSTAFSTPDFISMMIKLNHHLSADRCDDS
jgi:ribosomal protein L12E/L44/L45/RPP1/RPP2